MPVDNRRPPNSNQPQPQSQPQPQAQQTPAPATRQTGAASAERQGKKKQVNFAPQDTVATYRPGEGLAGHDLPVPRAAKPPAPAPTPNTRPACAHITERNGSKSILWPSGQRYSGSYDEMNSPHGTGSVRLADGHDHVSTWSHGLCIAVAGDAQRAKAVEAYVSPPSRRTATPHPTTNPGGASASSAGGLLGRLRHLSRKNRP